MTLTMEDRKLSSGIAKFTEERREPKIQIKRHFTYPNKDPYEEFNYGNFIGSRFIKDVRKFICRITDKGIENLFFDEVDSFSFEAELAYLILNNIIDLELTKVNLCELFYNQKFNIDDFLQTTKIVSIAMLIMSDEI